MIENFQVEISECGRIQEHDHSYIELVYVIEGTMHFFVDGQESVLVKDAILVINQNQKHYYVADGKCLHCSLKISYQMFSEKLRRSDFMIECNTDAEDYEACHELRKILRDLLRSYLQNQNHEPTFGELGLYYLLLDLLAVKFTKLADHVEGSIDSVNNSERIRFINDYIHPRYNQSISLKDLAEQLYLSEAYLSRFFKQNYGMTFTEYVTHIRILHASEDLLSTDHSVTQVALNNGFSTAALFNKAFKKQFGKTPTEYRNQFKKIEIEENTVSDQIITKVQDILDKEISADAVDPEKKALIIECTAAKYQPYEKNWNQVINVGAFSDLLESDMQEHVLLMQEHFHFQYIRLWSVFSEELLATQAKGKRNYRKLDIVLDFLVANKLKPFLDFGQKPKRIMRALTSDLIIREKEDTSDFDEWKATVEAFVKHVIHRYGKDEVETWKIEIWNGGQEVVREEKNMIEYLKFFRTCYDTIKKQLPNMEVGGYGGTAGFDKDLFVRDLHLWKQYAPLPDFYSAMIYGYEKAVEDVDVFNIQRMNTSFLSQYLDDIGETMEREHFPVKKLYVTEWSKSLFDRNFMNDTCFQGADNMCNLILSIGKAQMLGYYHGSDRFSDYYDSANLLYGGRGLLTKNGIIKPAGYAFTFMNQLYDYVIDKASRYMITTDGRNGYGIVCHNRKQPNYYYNKTKEEDVSCEKIEHYFEDAEPLELNFVIHDVADEVYQMRILRINTYHGSVMEQWKAMGYCDDSSKEIMRYIKHNSEPIMSIERLTVTDGQLSIRITLLENEIAFLGIEQFVEC